MEIASASQREPRFADRSTADAGCSGRPNLFVVGAPKAATTSLYAFLARHPDVFMSPNKEPHFFSSFTLDTRLERFFTVVRDRRAYDRLFAGAGSAAVRGEASTSYLADPEAPARIATHSPGARIVAVLRDPVERAYSQYLYNVREGTETRTFRDAVTAALEDPAGERWPADYIRAGLYAAGIARFREIFGSRLLVLFFDDLVRDPVRFGDAVLEFLELDRRVGGSGPVPLENAYGRPREGVSRLLLRNVTIRLAARRVVPERFRPAFRRLLIAGDTKRPLDDDLAGLLAEAYRADARRLESLLGARPPWTGPVA